MKRLGFFLALCLAGALQAQTISGRVFSTDARGVSRPARNATIYLLRQDDKEFAAAIWLDAYAKAVDKRLQAMAQSGSDYERQNACRARLLIFNESYEAAFSWATRTNQGSQMIAAISNEAGNFSVDAPAGNYIVLARDRQGEAWWRGVASTKLGNTTIALSEPAVSCEAAK